VLSARKRGREAETDQHPEPRRRRPGHLPPPLPPAATRRRLWLFNTNGGCEPGELTALTRGALSRPPSTAGFLAQELMTSCYCDYEPASAYASTRPIARKAHRCYECGGNIAPGDRYERASGIWEQQPQNFKTCVHCLAMRDLVASHLRCFCWEHGNLIENIVEAVRESDDIPGLKMAVGRLVVAGRRARSLSAKESKARADSPR
jgi:hypothetical protein